MVKLESAYPRCSSESLGNLILSQSSMVKMQNLQTLGRQAPGLDLLFIRLQQRRLQVRSQAEWPAKLHSLIRARPFALFVTMDFSVLSCSNLYPDGECLSNVQVKEGKECSSLRKYSQKTQIGLERTKDFPKKVVSQPRWEAAAGKVCRGCGCKIIYCLVLCERQPSTAVHGCSRHKQMMKFHTKWSRNQQYMTFLEGNPFQILTVLLKVVRIQTRNIHLISLLQVKSCSVPQLCRGCSVLAVRSSKV